MSELKGRGADWTEERGTSDEGRRRLSAPRKRAGDRAMSSAFSRAVGAATGSTLALALLVFGCVFAAMAGPALSLHTRSEALQQTLAGLSATTRTVQASTSLSDFTGPLVENGFSQALTAGELPETTRELSRGFTALGLRLGPGAWAGLSSKLYVITSGAGPHAQAGLPPKLEVVYRDPLAGNARLVAGTFASTAVPAGMVGVAATTQMTYRFGLHPGGRLSLTTPDGPVGLFITAIVAERAPGSTFWTQDSTVGTPSLEQLTAESLPFWAGGVIADPGQLAALQTAFSGAGLELNWEFPLSLSGLSADQVQGYTDALNRAVSQPPALTGPLAASADAVTVSSPLFAPLAQFLATQAAVETVLLLLFVSLIVVGAAVILLAARMIVARRDGELTMLRARGGSLGQMAAVMERAALIAAVPAAAVGVILAAVTIPGGVGTLDAWWLAGIAVLAALAGPPLLAVWLHRRPAPATNPARVTSADTGRRGRAWRRPVAEITAIAASVAGLVVLREQGVPAAGNGGTDVYLTITPVLVAVPVVLVTLRLYPLIIRGLLAASARGAGATGFVALSRAARSSLTGVLPAFALVLALSVATFAGMVSEGIARGEVAASWHTTGADVLIESGPYTPPVSPGGVRAIAAVRGVRAAAEVWSTTWVTPFGQPVTLVAVNPARYAAVVAGTPYPAFPAAKLSPAPGGIVPFGGTVPVLASPAAAALLGAGTTRLATLAAMGPVQVRVVGTLSSTPAQPGGGAFLVMPLETLPGPAGQPLPGTVLVSGAAIDRAQLTAVAGKIMPGNITTYRTSVAASLASSPLQHGAGLIIALTDLTAAAFGLFIVILGLALGSAERELTLARLTVMGHERAAGLVLAEAMPAVLAAVLAGAVCAVLLPRVIGSSIDLSAFTGTSAPVQFQPDVLALGLPAATIVVLAVAVLVAETRTLRRHDVTGTLRAY
jgi:putative ABC transport system permease protein